MPSSTRHIAEITDPVTGDIATVTADSEAELEQLITSRLEESYPTPPE